MTRRARELGFTLMETVLVALVLTSLTIGIVESLSSFSRTQAFNRGQVRTTDVADAIVRAVSWDVTTSVRVFTSDAISASYWLALDTSSVQAIPGSRLPALTNRGYVERDEPGKYETGNILFLGCRVEPLTVNLAADGLPPDNARVDQLRFVVYCPVRVPLGGGQYKPELDMTRWCSVRVARYTDVSTIDDPVRRAAIWRKVYESGVVHAWDPSKDRNQGIYSILPTGSTVLLLGGAKIPPDPTQVRGSLAASRRVAIAKNNSLSQVSIPGYAEINGPPTSMFPAGFEIKVDGPATGRMVLVRMVLTVTTEHGFANFAEAVRLVSCHDG